MQRIVYLVSAWLLVSCSSSQKTEKSAPEKEIWVLSEAYPHEHYRIEFYKGYAEGIREFIKEFREAPPGQITSEISSMMQTTAEIAVRGDLKANLVFNFVAPIENYNGVYAKESTGMKIAHIKAHGDLTGQKSFYYTEDDTLLYAYLKSKKKLKLDVIWGPTQPEVMAQMFKYTNPSAQDYIYDLGCGDGRILITAAKKFGSKGLGADIDPIRINAGIKMATNAGVVNKVTLLNKNLFDIDISPASIVTLYLNIKTNRRLRPKLFNELKPGTQVVSHNWHMGDWQSDKMAYTSQGTRVVYYWKIPANVSGMWEGKIGSSSAELVLRQQFQMVSGELKTNQGNHQIKNIPVDGTNLTITLADKTTLTLTSQGEQMTGTLAGKETIVLSRKSGTAIAWPAY